MEKAKIESVIRKMMEFDAGDPRRIQHFIKVYEFAHMIGVLEGLDGETQHILDTAAVLHDIGILPAEREYGRCDGKLQEKVGPKYAREMLELLGGFTEAEIDRICYLIAHHHTYTDVDGLDYRILLEADFLVNAYEDEISEEGIRSFRENVFRTESGKQLLDVMYSGRRQASGEKFDLT